MTFSSIRRRSTHFGHPISYGHSFWWFPWTFWGHRAGSPNARVSNFTWSKDFAHSRVFKVFFDSLLEKFPWSWLNIPKSHFHFSCIIGWAVIPVQSHGLNHFVLFIGHVGIIRNQNGESVPVREALRSRLFWSWNRRRASGNPYEGSPSWCLYWLDGKIRRRWSKGSLNGTSA